MNEDFDYGFGVDEATVRAERQKARKLRKTRWWQQKIADGICSYCRRKFPVKELTMDHIIPLSRGGRSSKGNLVPCCKECNTAKKTELPPELEDL
ncbi:MAG: HNH endonuclease [Candidatus Electrothrix sp. EH2]|nr:HNH endonuclease [Candidatus Electrothrix sp. EH2]